MAIEQLGVAEADTHLKKGGAVLVDVREQDEWESGRIPGAMHVPLSQFAQRYGELPEDKLLILQCATGVRSQQAAMFLEHNGYPRVANLAPGIVGWAQAGLPVER